MTLSVPNQFDIARWAREVKAATVAYQVASDKLLAYARHGDDPREMIERLQRVISTINELRRVCETVPASLGLLADEEYPGIIDIPEEDIIEL